MRFYFCCIVVNQTTALCSPGAQKPHRARDPGQVGAAGGVEPRPSFQLDEVTTSAHCLQLTSLDLRVAIRKARGAREDLGAGVCGDSLHTSLCEQRRRK